MAFAGSGPSLWSFLAALVCVAIMGFAIQRGGTCTVAAVEEVVESRTAWRLLSLAEASLWVAAGLLVALRWGWLQELPAGHALTAWTLIGAAALGLGAFVNGACVIGSVARIGSGEWAYLATPVGFYWGSLSALQLGDGPQRPLAPPASLLHHAPPALLWLFGLFVAWRLARAGGAVWPRPGRTPRPWWSPHTATWVIGMAFFLSWLLVGGAWAYSDVLAELARAMGAAVGNLGGRLLLMAALLAGALVGGWSAGLWRPTLPRATRVMACAAGGFLMGWGSFLIPGGNDGLILLGMPLLYPYAWLAFATMVAVILLAKLVQR